MGIEMTTDETPRWQFKPNKNKELIPQTFTHENWSLKKNNPQNNRLNGWGSNHMQTDE